MVTMSITASCGTSSADPVPPGGDQFGSGVPDAAAAAFVPSHLIQGTVPSGGPDVTVTGNPTTIDTDHLTIDGKTSPYFVLRNGYAVLSANRVVFDHDVVITGPRPLIVAADGDVTVTASIDLSAHGSAPGPGAATFGAGEGGPGDTYITPGGAARVSSGGGGGGHGSPGAPGGGNDELIRAGVGGMVYGAQLSDRLIGGAPGGMGGDAGTDGGAGGGALQISSATAISITGPHIAAGGGGGQGGAAPPAAGPGAARVAGYSGEAKPRSPSHFDCNVRASPREVRRIRSGTPSRSIALSSNAHQAADDFRWLGSTRNAWLRDSRSSTSTTTGPRQGRVDSTSAM